MCLFQKEVKHCWDTNPIPRLSMDQIMCQKTKPWQPPVSTVTPLTPDLQLVVAIHRQCDLFQSFTECGFFVYMFGSPHPQIPAERLNEILLEQLKSTMVQVRVFQVKIVPTAWLYHLYICKFCLYTGIVLYFVRACISAITWETAARKLFIRTSHCRALSSRERPPTSSFACSDCAQ